MKLKSINFFFVITLCMTQLCWCDSAEQIFTHIYTTGYWAHNANQETASGHGSKLSSTKTIREQLPLLLKKLEIKTLLDIPCGDFNWMKTIDLENYIYIGADIVLELIKDNQKKHTSKNRKFMQLDLVKDQIPQVDLIMCRDCLVHLSFQEILQAIKNIKKSKSTYLLMTHYTNLNANTDIKTGSWRPLNFQSAPFNFSQPFLIINEQSPVGPDKDHVKTLALWRLDDINI